MMFGTKLTKSKIMKMKKTDIYNLLDESNISYNKKMTKEQLANLY